MRRKRTPAPDPVIASEILDKAKRAAHPDKLPRSSKCVICGAECAANSPNSSAGFAAAEDQRLA